MPLTGDLGSVEPEVHAKGREVLGFWFGGLMPEQWFAKSDSVDAAIRERFAPLVDEVLGSGAEGWRDDPETLLAAVIVLDQFSRNIHRGTARAFAADPLAQELTCLAIDRGWDADLSTSQRQFLYMPLMHAEDSELQTLCLKCFDQPGLEPSLDFAREHAEVIARFGRFPTRNAALERESTAEERVYLAQPGVGW
jgi:uncharacterized protein (DUF924 family)